MIKVDEACSNCGSEFAADNRLVYRSLCKKCYVDSHIPCDRCRENMQPETHRSNNGCCFKCFYLSETNTVESDRSLIIEDFQKQLSSGLPDDYIQFSLQHDGHQRYSHISR